MFDLSKIINGLNELKTMIEKNRVKNLRAEIAAKIYVEIQNRSISDIIASNCASDAEEAKLAVVRADALLLALGESRD